MSNKMESTLTGVRDTDLEILLRTDYPSLIRACSTDQYLRLFCQDDNFWARKLFHDYKITTRLHAPTFAQEYKYQYYTRLNPNTEAVRGNLDNLIGIWTFTGKLPKQEIVNVVANHGDIKMLTWLDEKGMLPSSVGADFALGQKHWDLVDWLISQKVYPSTHAINMVIQRGDPEEINWLLQRKLSPGEYVFNLVKDPKISDLLISYGIIPTPESMIFWDTVIQRSDPVEINWLLQRKLFPGKKVFNRIEDPKIIDLLISYGIIPDPESMAYFGNLYSLKRSLEYEQPNLRNLAIAAASGGKLDILEWLIKQGVSMDNSVHYAAAVNNHLGAVKWIEEYGIRPTINEADEVLYLGSVDLLEHFARQGIFPSSIGISKALKQSRPYPEVIEWIYRRVLQK